MPSHNFGNFQELLTVVNEHDNLLNQIRTGAAWDFKLRRITNAAPSETDSDYVIRKELLDQAASLQFQIDEVNKTLMALGEVVQLPQELFADATASVTALFGSFTDVTGCTLSLNRKGLYVVTAYCAVAVDALAGQVRVYLDVDGSNQSQFCALSCPGQASLVQMWPVLVLSDTAFAIKLVTDKAVNAGSASVIITDTRLHARWVGPPNGYSVTV